MGAWASGEDYVLGERVQDLRRDGAALAGRVQGTHGDYWVRLELSLPVASACDCGRPRCRHAAALVQAYLARRWPVTDVGLLVDEFLRHPRREPLTAAAMGEDFVSALKLPLIDVEDIWSLQGERRLLALDAALRVAPDPYRLLLRALPEAEHDRDLQVLLASAFSNHPPAAAVWPSLLGAAPPALAPLISDLRPEDLGPEAVLAALWQAAADKDRQALLRLAPHAAALAPKEAADALEHLSRETPELIPALVMAARGARRLQRVTARLLRWADSLPEDETAAVEQVLGAQEDLPPRLRLLLRVRAAAAAGGAAQVLAARRAALSAGAWPGLRPVMLRRIRRRSDGPILETQLLIAEGDLGAAARTAERCRSSPLPERLVAEALRSVDPAEARRHELRAQAIAAQLQGGEERPRSRFGDRRGRNPRPRR